MSRNDRTDRNTLLGNGTISLAVGLSFILAACSSPGVKSSGEETVGSSKLPHAVDPRAFTASVVGDIKQYCTLPTENLPADKPGLFAPVSKTLQRVDITFDGWDVIPPAWSVPESQRQLSLIGVVPAREQSSLLSQEIVWQAPYEVGQDFVIVECHFSVKCDGVISNNLGHEIFEGEKHAEAAIASHAKNVASINDARCCGLGRTDFTPQDQHVFLQSDGHRISARVTYQLALSVIPQTPFIIDARGEIGIRNLAFLSGSPPYLSIG